MESAKSETEPIECATEKLNKKVAEIKGGLRQILLDGGENF